MMNSEQHGPLLAVHEWLAVITIICVLIFITSITYFTSNTLPTSFDTPHYIVSPIVEITIEGAVESPGIYRVKKGTPLIEVITLAKPLPDADLSRFDEQTTAKRKRTIKIKPLKTKRRIKEKE